MKNLIINIYKTLFFFDFAVIVMYYIPKIKTSSPAYYNLWSELISLAVVILFTVIFTRVVEKGTLKVQFFKNKFRNYSIGLLCGVIITALPALILWLSKSFTAEKSSVKHIVIWLLAIFFNILGTELLLRGYLFKLYRKYYSFAVTTVIISLLNISLNISILEKGIIYILNILALNIMLCILCEYTKSLLTAVTAHFVYYTAASFIIDSEPLTKDYPHLLSTEFGGKAFITGGENKLYGSILLLICTVLVCIFFINKLYVKKDTAKKPKKQKSRTAKTRRSV